jgi:predicted component of type VI protein secretion system
MRTGPNPGKSFELAKNELYIGRDINNDIVINDSEISRKHARLILQAGGYVLEDLGSTNGSFVNGQRLMGPHVLRPGEMVMFGENVSLAFEAGYDPDATMVAGAVQTSTLMSEPPPQPQVVIPPTQAESPKPVYTGQVPAGPAEPYYEPIQEPQKSNRTMLYAGIGCLVVLLCGMAIAAAFIFDSLNLYCTPPFNMIFPCG